MLRARHTEPLEFDQIMVRFAVGFVITTYVAASHLLKEPDAQSAALIVALLVSPWIGHPARSVFGIGTGVKFFDTSGWDFIAAYDYTFKDEYEAHSAYLRAAYEF